MARKTPTIHLCYLVTSAKRKERPSLSWEDRLSTLKSTTPSKLKMMLWRGHSTLLSNLKSLSKIQLINSIKTTRYKKSTINLAHKTSYQRRQGRRREVRKR